MATGGTPELIAQLTNAEAHRILSEIAALSTNLEQLVHESVSSVLLQRTPPAAVQNGGAPAAPVPAPTAAAPEADRVWGKDKLSWSDLTAEEQMAAQVLGYDGASFDAGLTPDVCNERWARLVPQVQGAARQLGYTAELWDAEIFEEGAEAQEVAAAPREPTPPPQNFSAPAVPVVPVVPVVAVPQPQVPPAANTVAGRSVATDGSTWSEMTHEEQSMAVILGYDQASWDEGAVPPTCTNPWRHLGAVEQDAARVLGYTPETWDLELTGEAVPPPAAAVPAPAVAPPAASTSANQAAQPALAPVAGNANNRWSGTSAPVPRPVSSSRDVSRFDSGMMFGCKNDTYQENISRKLFGLPANHFRTAEKIGENTALFLFNYSTRKLHGIFIRDGPAAMNLEPNAWAQYRKPGDRTDSSPFPSQVRWQVWRQCSPIREDLWKEVPTVKRAGAPRGTGPPTIYDLWMSGQQAQRLAELCLRHG